MGLTQVNTDGVKDDAVTAGKIPANAIGSSEIADDAVGLAQMAAGTDGQIITYDASGNPVAVGPGTDGQVLTSTGAGSPPAFESISIPAGTTINNNADNRVITGSGTANTLEGEANLTFNGSQLDLDTGSGTFNRWKTDQLRFNSTGTAHIDHYTTGQDFKFRTSVSSGADTTAFEIKSNGNIKTNGNLIIGTSGKGIDFSVQTASSETGVTVEDEVLDHYEKGTWTPFFYGSSTAGTFSVSVRPARYVRIGDLVWINMYIQGGSLSGAAGDLKIGGLPYDLEGNPDAAFTVAYANGFYEMPDNSVLLIINGGSNTLRVMKTAAHYAGNTSGLAVSSDSMALVIGGCYSVA